MNHKPLLIIAAILTVSCLHAVPLYKQADAPIEKRVEDLLSRMTLEEKILQMNQVTLGTNLNQNNIGGEPVEPVLGSYITYTATDPTEINQMQKRAMDSCRTTKAARMYSYISLQSRPMATERWRKARRLSSRKKWTRERASCAQ